jgi:hypothetical protein
MNTGISIRLKDTARLHMPAPEIAKDPENRSGSFALFNPNQTAPESGGLFRNRSRAHIPGSRSGLCVRPATRLRIINNMKLFSRLLPCRQDL